MRLALALRGVLFGHFAGAMAAGCGASPTDPRADPSFVRLVSEPGDFIGGGQSYEYTRANATLVFSSFDGYLHVGVSGAEGWTGDFRLPSGVSTLQPGSYPGAERYPLNDPAEPGLSWTGQHRGCNTISGAFTIDAATYDAGILKSIDLRFEQHCEGNAAALRGTLHLTAD